MARPLYLLMLALLGVVFALGITREGAQSWLGSQALSFQPSEPAKLLLIISLAAWWSAREQRRNSWITLIGSLLSGRTAACDVLLQPDFGTAMVMGFVWLGMAWSADYAGSTSLRWP